MKVSERTLKWALNFYPPLLFQRIIVKKFHKNFRGVDVKIKNSIVNRNYNGSIFGGTIYAATDPFYALLFDQILKRKGYKVRVWLKSASIQYLKPGKKDLHFTVKITDEMLADAEQCLTENGKFVKAYPMELYDESGLLCATVMNEVYLRNKHFGETQKVSI
ncbi:DUF4442 domain-containing protein [Pedobacter flavus]|uniref:DUF4442 domain-containing protein n=1 Tax=Pedobacter flavus TaxID=3113906 RepID=A0ABU7H2M5_9SPHI|nr:DUF4442 domain-containing protein [Pedobacter sp. VNH31]MEE1885549.1 DUF4442 domain-containing protein [Pedobacter sp. VNH31]